MLQNRVNTLHISSIFDDDFVQITAGIINSPLKLDGYSVIDCILLHIIGIKNI